MAVRDGARLSLPEPFDSLRDRAAPPPATAADPLPPGRRRAPRGVDVRLRAAAACRDRVPGRMAARACRAPVPLPFAGAAAMRYASGDSTARWRGGTAQGSRMKVAQVINVDFALRHFLLPLMRGARERGHEVVGLCAEGPLLDLPRAEGFRIIPVPMARSLNPVAQVRAFRALLRIFRRRGLRPGAGPHADQRRAGAAGGPVRAAAAAAHRLYLPRLPVQPARARGGGGRCRSRLEFAAGRITDTYLTVSAEEAADARRLRIHRAATAVGNGRDPALFRPDPAARAAVRAELGARQGDCVIVAVSRLVRHKGYPELLAAMRGAAGIACSGWSGDRLPSDHGEDMEPLFAAAAAALGPRFRRLGYRTDVPRLLAGGGCLRPALAFRGPADVGDRGACSAACRWWRPISAARARWWWRARPGCWCRRPRWTRWPRRCRPWRGIRARRARMGEAGRPRALEHYTEAKVVGRTLDLLGL